ncbi:MAG: ribosomal L7Ae/L30e/S12e/Gadd45 family protein [Bacilli bacterium]|jgi:ribosomal protein L7Ae-like RNA K-turn-binding protein
MNDRVHGYLGLALRAGKALVGEAIIKVWSVRPIYLLLIAVDATSHTQNKLAARARDEKVTVLHAYRKAELGRALGFDEVSSVAISDKGLAQQIIDVIKEDL